MIKELSKNKKLVVTMGIVVVSLFLYGIYPSENTFQQIIKSIFFLFVIPFLYVKIILKEPLKSYGLEIDGWQKHLPILFILLVASLALFYVISNYTYILEGYRPPASIYVSFVSFLGYEIFLTGFFAILYEFLFRGLLMFSLERIIKKWSFIIQAAVFAIVFLYVFAPGWSLILFTIAAPFSGYIAYRSRSIILSFIYTLFFIILADAITIALTKA
jgi:membrane protease YdiL (CAAX protease family)